MLPVFASFLAENREFAAARGKEILGTVANLRLEGLLHVRIARVWRAIAVVPSAMSYGGLQCRMLLTMYSEISRNLSRRSQANPDDQAWPERKTRQGTAEMARRE